jgi:WD40 repeat protein
MLRILLSIPLWCATTNLRPQEPNTGVELSSDGLVFSLQFSPDGRTLVSGGMENLKFWDVPSGKCTSVIKANDDPLFRSGFYAVRFSPDGSKFATAKNNNNLPAERIVQVWETASATELKRFAREARCLDFSPDGKLLVLGSAGKSAVVDVASGRDVAEMAVEADSVNAVAFSPDGKTVAVAMGHGGHCDPSTDVAVGLWEAVTGRLVRRWPSPGDSRGLMSVAWSPDGKTLATAGDSGVTLWEPGSGKVVNRFAAQDLQAVVFAPDGSRLIAGGRKGMHVWDTTSGRQLAAFKSAKMTVFCYAVAVSPDGKRFAVGGHDSLRLWESPR